MSLQDVISRIEAAATGAGRSPDSVTLVAVSKAMTAEQILDVYGQGHRDFGENRAQEMSGKAELLPSDIRWHYVGALQSNKVGLVRAHTALLHSMDRRSLADAWSKGARPAPPCLLQVNLGEEPQKSGVAPEDVDEAADWLLSEGFDLVGLMAIPPIPDDPEDSRPHFRRLRALRDRVAARHGAVRHLSMGMTDDFEVAIEEGATIIRVGRAIFGPRN